MDPLDVTALLDVSALLDKLGQLVLLEPPDLLDAMEPQDYAA